MPPIPSPTPAPPARDAHPDFDKYRVVARIGAGGMADVFLAALSGPVGFQKLLVVKRLRADLADDPSFRAMLLDEARLAARLSHPNVVQTFEVGEHNGCPFIAMEYLDGQSLHRIVRAAKQGAPLLGAHMSAQIVADALAGLHYAHELRDYDGRSLGIVHRDISPHNLFVTYDGEVKVVDFGIAKASLQGATTEVGVLKGKVAYMAPEQARGEPLDRRADIFAMGIVLWELLTRARLFEGRTAMASMTRILSEETPSVARHAPEVDPELEGICLNALARDPALRFQTAAEMRDAIQSYLESSGKRLLRREEIGQRLREVFAEERARVEQRVEACMNGTRLGQTPEEGPQSLPVLRFGDSLNNEMATPTKKEVTGAGLRATPSHAASMTPEPLSGTSGRVQKPRAAVSRRAVVAAASLVAVGAVAAIFVTRMSTPSQGAHQEATPIQPIAPTPVPSSEDVLFRMRGSNTVGAELAPALAQAFLEHLGATAVSHAKGEGTHTTRLLATMPGKSKPQAITIEAEGSATAFDGLATGACDIGMSSRPIKPEEAALLASKGFGDMRSPASEHVVALDGIAVVVHPNSSLRSITRAQITSVFSGEVTDWSALGAPAGPIAVYARDDVSGTFDTFKHLVLENKKLVPDAKRFADSDRLSDAVASDPRGIGFIGLAYVRNAKSLAVSDMGTPAMFPSAFTVTTEGYLLSRRLYFYTSSLSDNSMTLDFVNFALSTAGQRVVRASGFVDLNVELKDPEKCTGQCSARYEALVKRARRLSLDFRFRPGGADLDSRATRDIDRLLLFLRGHAGRLMLFGFSDNDGDAAQNIQLSRARAKHIDSELSARGVHAAVVDGFGPEMPIASNLDETGRERNRRVEVWLEADSP